MRPFIPVLVSMCLGLLFGFCVGYLVRAVTAPAGAESDITRFSHRLSKRPFESKVWRGYYADINARLDIRQSMRDSIVEKFKPGAQLADVLAELGGPDIVRDLQNEEGSQGRIQLSYVVGINDNDGLYEFTPIPDMLFMVFTGDGHLVYARVSPG